MDRWTEYCKDLYNYLIKTYRAKVETDNIREDDKQQLPILNSEVIHPIKSLKNGKSSGIDNLPIELLNVEGGAYILFMYCIYNIYMHRNIESYLKYYYLLYYTYLN